MADLDQLSLQITSDSQKAEDAINFLVKGLENLNSALGKLDVSKVTQFANAVSKLSNIGTSTNTTSKAIKGLSSEISKAFGIRTKQGVDEVKRSIEGLYEATKNGTGDDFFKSFKGVEDAIKDNYRLKTSVDSTTKAVREYVSATNKSGSKVGMADMVKEFGEDFKSMSSVLGKAFKNNLPGKNGAQDLAIYLSEMNDALGTQFDTKHVEKGFSQLVETLRAAKDATLDYKEAQRQGAVSDEDVWRSVDSVAESLGKLTKEQEKFGATNGLGGVTSFFQQISNLNLPDMSGMAQAVKAVADNPPVQTAKAVEDIGRAASVVAKEAEAASIALDGAFNSKKRILGEDANVGNPKVTEFGFVSDIQGLESVDYAFKQTQASAEKLLPAVINVKDNFRQLFEADLGIDKASQAINSVTGSMQSFALAVQQTQETALQLATNLEKAVPALSGISNFQPPDLYTAVAQFTALGRAAAYAYEQMKNIGMIGKSTPLLEGDSYIDTSGEWVNEDVVDAAEQVSNAVEDVRADVEDFHEELEKKPTVAMGDVLSNVVELGNALGEVSEKFNGMAEKGIGLFKLLTKPLQMAAGEYVEKFESMGNTIKNFQKTFQARLTKMSQFWKRTMKTFTFMLVRKAITAILKEIGTAVQSLALYSNAMGTAFNKDLSLMVADFQYLGRSIVSVFAPLLSYIAPIIDAIVDRIATLLSYIGMLIAALGGSTSFTKAKKNVGNYAESLDQASKSAKNLTMGIDELNILSEGGGGSAKPYDGWEDAWEQVEIPSKIQDFAKKLRDMFAQFLEPLKKAWDAMKEYFKSAFNYMKQELAKLAKSIWDAFIQVWNEDATVEMFKNIIGIVADLMIVIGNLAKNFREAWDEVVDGASRGVQIFRGIRDIFAILVKHVRNVSLYMVKWSSELNFRPLLDGLISLLNALKPLAEFIGGLFEDIMKNVVLEYTKFMIEEGIPHLMHGIEEVVGSFNFGKLRSQLQPLETSFVELMKRIDKGVVDAFTNIGKAIGEFSQTDNFQAFLSNIQYLMDSISQEDVQKILEGIGLGILNISEALVNFVGSDTFKSFVDMLNDWLDSKSAEDIAGILDKIAIAIAGFKFAAFATEGLSGFFRFASVLVSLNNLHTIATELAEIAGTSAAAGGGFATFASAAGIAAGVILVVVGVAYSLIQSFGGLDGFLQRIGQTFYRVGYVIQGFAKILNLDEHIKRLQLAFDGLLKKLGTMSDFWNVLLTIIEFVAGFIGGVLVISFEQLVDGLTIVIDVVGRVIDLFAGLGTTIVGVYEGLTSGDWSKVGEGVERAYSAFSNDFLVDAFVGSVDKGIDQAAEAVAPLGERLFGGVNDSIKSVDWEKIPSSDTVGKGVANSVVNAYSSAAQGIEPTLRNTNMRVFQQGLDITGQLDYKTPATTTTTHIMGELYGSAESADYAKYGTIVNTALGNSITDNTQPFTDANTTTAQEGAALFGQEYANSIGTDTIIPTALGDLGRTSGLELSNGFAESMDSNIGVTQASLAGWFMKIQAGISEQMASVKSLFEKLFNNAIATANVNQGVSTLFANLTTAINTNINLLGNTLVSTTLPTFLNTYILPFFTLERWQPLFDNLLNTVFIPMFEVFRTWFTNDAMTPWWTDDVMFWFTADKWNEDIFKPLHDTIQENWDTFSEWWDTSMTTWWENQVEVWFDKQIWTDVLTNVLDAAEDVFELVKEVIKEKIEKAQEAVEDACEKMKNAIEEVLELIDELMDALDGLGDIGGNVNISFSGRAYANGGFPEAGSLFLAGEAGAEFVTNVGGRTGVVSNHEITGIADAIYATSGQESQLLSELISISRQTLDKDPVVIGDREIAKLATSGRSKLGMSIIS